MATPKQRLAAEKYLENLRAENPKLLSEVLKEAGYSDTMSTTPSQVTNSKGFLQVLEEAGVTDNKLSQVMAEGLAATKAVVMGIKSEESFVDVQPDYAIRHKYLETALKTKGLVNKDDPGGNTYNTFIQQNNLNPNAPEAKTLVDNTLEMLMKQTKRKAPNE